jgi:hypothetical protein
MKRRNQAEDDLMLLIKSLNSSEKRYFKIFSKNEVSEEKAYMYLFEIINSSQSPINNQTLKQKLSDKGYNVDIIKTKQYLFNNIIKSLILFDIDNDSEIAIKMKMLEVRVLLKRNLLNSVTHKLKLLEKICTEQNKTIVLSEIYGIQKTNTTNSINKVNSFKEIEALILDDKENNSKLINEMNLKSILLELSYLNSQEFTLNENDFTNKCNEISIDDRLKIDVNKQSYTGQMLYFLIVGYLNLKQKNYKNAVEYFSKYINLLDKNKFLLKQNQFNYISGLGNLIAAYGKLKQYKKIERLLAKLKVMKFEDERLNIMQIKSYYLHISQLYTETKRFIDLCNLYSSFQIWVSKNKNKIEKQILLKIEYGFSVAFLVNGNFGKSLVIVNRILSEPKTKSYMKVAVSAKIIAALCHYKKGDYEVVYSVLRSLSRQLSIKDLEQTKEYVFSKCFTKDIVCVNNNYKALGKIYNKLEYNNVSFDFEILKLI